MWHLLPIFLLRAISYRYQLSAVSNNERPNIEHRSQNTDQNNTYRLPYTDYRLPLLPRIIRPQYLELRTAVQEVCHFLAVIITQAIDIIFR